MSRPSLRVDGDRLWDSLMEMATIGATAAGGCCRLALTDQDKAGRDLFASWCRDAGCSIGIDDMGNIFARRPGHRADLPAVAIGSHLDTQPHGGKFDGVFGVLAGLEVIRTLNTHDVETRAPIDVVTWTNEEGARFAPAMLASGVSERRQIRGTASRLPGGVKTEPSKQDEIAGPGLARQASSSLSATCFGRMRRAASSIRCMTPTVRNASRSRLDLPHFGRLSMFG